jgi:hypothetical protein
VRGKALRNSGNLSDFSFEIFYSLGQCFRREASQRLNGEWFAFPQSDLNFLLDYFNTYNQGWVLLKAFYEESKQSVLDGKPVTQFQGSLWDLVIKLSTSDAKPDSGKGGPDEQDIS